MSGLDTMTTMGVPNKTFDYDGKTIVDCPACKTRFCVKDEILERHSEPNFHCSRCDHVFRLNISELRANKITEEASKTIPTEARPAATIRNFNIPRDVAGGGSISAPHESARNEDRFGTRTLSGQSPMIGAHTSKEIRPRRQLKAIDLLKHVNIFSKKNPSSPNQDDSISSSAPYAAQVKDDNRWQDMLSITTPIIIFLLTLSLVSFYFVKNPGTASSVISAIVPSAPRTTPAGLHITETSFTKVNLDSGEEVAVVTGEIQNKTDAMYGSVILEAQAFDKEGTLIKKAMTNSGGALVNTRVQSLSPKLIEDIQTTKGPRRLTIGPNRAEKFAVALTGEEVKQAAYFSIRIYSVRAQS